MTMTQDTPLPSFFYTQFDDATESTLCFPADEDGVGPYWLASGELDASQGGSRSCEKVEVVILGNCHSPMTAYSGIDQSHPTRKIRSAFGVMDGRFQWLSRC